MDSKNRFGKPFTKVIAEPKPGQYGKRWTVDQLIKLLTDFSEGKSFIDIAVSQDRSVIACICKLCDLHLIRFNVNANEYRWIMCGVSHHYTYPQLMKWQVKVNRQLNLVTTSQ